MSQLWWISHHSVDLNDLSPSEILILHYRLPVKTITLLSIVILRFKPIGLALLISGINFLSYQDD